MRMLEINLLPEELRRKKSQFVMPQINVSSLPIFIGAVALLISFHVILLVILNINKGVYTKMSKEWEQSEPLKKSIELVKRANIVTTGNVGAIEDLMAKKVSWFKKLNELSDLITPGVWYTRLSIDEKTIILEEKAQPGRKKLRGKGTGIQAGRKQIYYLVIEGEVSATYGEELAIIGKYIDGLKRDKAFFKDFSNIELDSTKLHTILDNDVMHFSINCYVKENALDDAG